MASATTGGTPRPRVAMRRAAGRIQTVTVPLGRPGGGYLAPAWKASCGNPKSLFGVHYRMVLGDAAQVIAADVRDPVSTVPASKRT